MSAVFYRAPDRLQSLLLAEPVAKVVAKPRNPDLYVGITLALCGLAVVVMAFAGWLAAWWWGMSTLPSCCSLDCQQGRTCPARKQAATNYCDKSRQPCVTPFQCLPACKLVTTNNPATPGRKPSSIRAFWMWLAVLAVFSVAAALTVRAAELLFN